MNLRIRSSQDLWSGLLFAAVGIVTVVAAMNYPIGTARNIGPGYFPVLLGGVLVIIGIAVGIKGLAVTAEPVEPFAFQPLIAVTAAVVAFGLLVRPFGLAVATLVMVAISSLAGRGFSLTRVVVLSVCLTAMAMVIFVTLLGLPLSLWPQAWS